jgi:hypothetical protein
LKSPLVSTMHLLEPLLTALVVRVFILLIQVILVQVHISFPSSSSSRF